MSYAAIDATQLGVNLSGLVDPSMLKPFHSGTALLNMCGAGRRSMVKQYEQSCNDGLSQSSRRCHKKRVVPAGMAANVLVART